MQPLAKRGVVERLPVLYLTDGNDSFDIARSISHGLLAAGQIQRFILVGIGYPGDHPFVGEILRSRDFTPERRREIQGFPRSSLIEGVPGIEDGKKRWNGAAEFLAFIRSELIPLIDHEYYTQPDERVYFGHSLGASLGLHALLSQPGLFNRYILSSPGLSWEGDPHGIEPVERFIASKRRLDAKVFLSVGSEEEFEARYSRSQFCSSYYRLAALMRRAQIPGLEFTNRIFLGETHASVWSLAFTHGVQNVLGSTVSAVGEFPLDATAGAETNASTSTGR
jgi:predicted alpha/beta superfamily hydrolase